MGMVLWAGSLLAQNDPTPREFSIKGKVKNGSPGEKVYLLFSANPPVTLDSTVIQGDGSFQLKGIEKEGGNFYLLDIANRQKIALLVEGGETFTVVTDGFERDASGAAGKVEITGSKNMEYYAQLLDLNQKMRDKVSHWNEAYTKASEKKDTKAIQEIQKAYQQAEDEHIGKIKAMIPEMGTAIVAVFAANNMLSPERDFETMDAVARLFEKEKPSPKIVQAYLGSIKRIRGVSIGEVAPDFTIDSPEGNKISLASLRGNYVLIDFWASWCGPCRMENPNVVKMYNKYKDKGFTIFGVSLDDNKSAWLAAIQKDGLTWNHGSELKKWNSPVAQTYGISAIPATYLLDKEGKVIAKNLRGAALENKLAQLLGQK